MHKTLKRIYTVRSSMAIAYALNIPCQKANTSLRRVFTWDVVMRIVAVAVVVDIMMIIVIVIEIVIVEMAVAVVVVVATQIDVHVLDHVLMIDEEEAIQEIKAKNFGLIEVWFFFPV